MRAAVAALVLLAGGCAAAPPPPPDLATVVGTVWTAGSEPRGSNVEWRVEVPVLNGEVYAGIAYNDGPCIGGWCPKWVVLIHPDYVRADIVAHEGGHIVCWARWLDDSEACANAVAASIGY